MDESTKYNDWVSLYLMSNETSSPDFRPVIVPCSPMGDRELNAKLCGKQPRELLPQWRMFFVSALWGFSLVALIHLGQGWFHFSKDYTWYPDQFFYSMCLLIPLFLIGRWRGVSAIVVDQHKIHFLCTATGKGLNNHYFFIRNIRSITLEPNEKEPWKSKIRIDEFKPSEWKPFKIKLEALGDRDRWRAVKAALVNSSIEIDPRIEDFLQPKHNDPSYTELWLEALGTVPGAESLEPLVHDSVMQSGRYIVERQIGRGGQGTAYLATVHSTADQSADLTSLGTSVETTESIADLGTDSGIIPEHFVPTERSFEKRVVLKEYVLPVYVDIAARRMAIERFEQEAKMLDRIDHQNIVKLEDFFVENMRAYLVLEYVPGVSLKELVETEGPLTEGRAIELGLCMIDILQYLHDKVQIIHQDFTPDNLILSGKDQVKLIDFMVARGVCDLSYGDSGGKLAYMSPEQFRGESHTNGDLYALGGTLFFLLTGEEPEPLTACDLSGYRSDVNAVLKDLVLSLTQQSLSRRLFNLAEIRTRLEHLR